MNVTRTATTIIIGHRDQVASIYGRAMAVLAIGLAVMALLADDGSVALGAVGLLFGIGAYFMLFRLPYETVAVFDAQARSIVVKRRAFVGGFTVDHTLTFDDIVRVLHLWQLNDNHGGGRWNAMIYLDAGSHGERIKVCSRPSHNNVIHKGPIGPLQDEANEIAVFVGAPYEDLTGFQPLDS